MTRPHYGALERDEHDDLPREQDNELPAGDMARIQQALRSPSRPYTGLSDEMVGCPGCWATITPDLLCEHDDEGTGPLCTNRCCSYWHGPTEAA